MPSPVRISDKRSLPYLVFKLWGIPLQLRLRTFGLRPGVYLIVMSKDQTTGDAYMAVQIHVNSNWFHCKIEYTMANVINAYDQRCR